MLGPIDPFPSAVLLLSAARNTITTMVIYKAIVVITLMRAGCPNIDM